jgi:hypothetical protein
MSEVEQRMERLPSDRAVKAAGAANRGNGDAGLDARGGAMHGGIAEDAARAAKIRRNAWLLAGLAVFFYVGYMAWMFLRSAGG